MSRMRPAFIAAAFTVLALSGIAFAWCATDQYDLACEQCLGLNGGNPDKMDDMCYAAKQARGIHCFQSAYPETYTAYRAGNCSEINGCMGALNDCVDSEKSGNDRRDCEQGTLVHCFREVENCMGQVNNICKTRVPPPPENPQRGNEIAALVGSLLRDHCYGTEEGLILIPALALCITLYSGKTPA